MPTALHLPHLRRPRASTAIAFAVPALVGLGLYLALTAIAGTGGDVSGLSLACVFALFAVPVLAISVQSVIRDGQERRAGSRIVLVAWSALLFCADFMITFAIGAGTCSNDAPPPAGSPVDRFCNGGGVGVFEWGLLSAFPVLLLGFLVRRRHPRNLPFVVALVTVATAQLALMAALP